MFTIILVCPTDRLLTRYRQVANKSPTVGRLLANSQPQLANCRLTVGRQLADSIFWELFFTITQTWATRTCGKRTNHEDTLPTIQGLFKYV